MISLGKVNAINILIIQNFRILSDLMSTVLQQESDINVVRAVCSEPEALSCVEKCDLALLSIDLPGHDTLVLSKLLTTRNPNLKLIITNVNNSNLMVPYFEVGAVGCILSEDSVDTLLDKLRAAHEGRALICPKMAATMVTRLKQLAETGAPTSPSYALDAITPREIEVLGLLEQKYSNREIAECLVVELGTVKNHVHNILKKLEVRDRQEAVVQWTLMKQ